MTSAQHAPRIASIALLVRDYEKAIDYGNRWDLIGPPAAGA